MKKGKNTKGSAQWARPLIWMSAVKGLKSFWQMKVIILYYFLCTLYSRDRGAVLLFSLKLIKGQQQPTIQQYCYVIESSWIDMLFCIIPYQNYIPYPMVSNNFSQKAKLLGAVGSLNLMRKQTGSTWKKRRMENFANGYCTYLHSLIFPVQNLCSHLLGLRIGPSYIN